MRVAIIGPGRVGGALAAALPADRYTVVATAGRDDDLVAAAKEGQLVIVSVPDDALPEVLRSAARDEAVSEGSRWIHTAGGHGLEVLRPVRLAGAAVAACHPAQTFPDPDTGRAALPGTAWAVTAREPDRAWAHAFVQDLGGMPVDVAEQSRRLYHTGLSVGSNHTAIIVALARELLLAAGITDPRPFLQPLVERSTANAVATGARALTGPIVRGDAGTIAAHCEALAEVLPEALDAYRSVTRLGVSQALRAGLDQAAANAVRAAVENGT